MCRQLRVAAVCGGRAVKHLTLPTLDGAVSTDADRIALIEHLSAETCRVHLKTIESAEVKKGSHNHFDARLSADELRHAIAEMDPGDVFDPWNLEMTGAE